MSNQLRALGRLERVDLREQWARESEDFTPWLALPENLELLEEAIGLELELQAREQHVGPFRADLLCRDVATNALVLIENQLNQTDHTHLGQLMTYAAGLDAVTIVWVAESFSEEHRAAIDWLNRITGEKFNFFGLEIELWRIDNSPPAPKFNIVAQPNEWTRTVEESAKKARSVEFTEIKLLQQEYWTAFQDTLKSIAGPTVRPRKPQAQHWMDYSIGRSFFTVTTYCNTLHDRIGVSLNMTGPYAKSYFRALEAQKAAIERDAGAALSWQELPGKQKSYVELVNRGNDPENRLAWPTQHKWLADAVLLFMRVFKDRVASIDIESDVTDSEGQ